MNTEYKCVTTVDGIKDYIGDSRIVSEFDISLWSSTVEFVTVGRDKDITVTFRDGTEIKA